MIVNRVFVGKMHQNSYQSIPAKSSSKTLELVYADVWGPAPMNSINDNIFYINFVDDFSRYNWLFPILTKSSVRDIFIKFKKMIEHQIGLKIKQLQTNNEEEFLALRSVLEDSGIIHRKSCPYVHQQMGVMERRHRHIVDCGISLLDQAKIPWSFWDYAFSSIVFLYNRTPTSVLVGKSPFELVFKKSPNLLNLQVFESLAFPNLRPSQKCKFSPQSTPHIFIGYPTQNHRYLSMNPFTKRVIVSNDMAFLENNFDYSKCLHSKEESQQSADLSLLIPILEDIAPSPTISASSSTPTEFPSTSDCTSPSSQSDSFVVPRPGTSSDSEDIGLAEPHELLNPPASHHMKT